MIFKTCLTTGTALGPPRRMDARFVELGPGALLGPCWPYSFWLWGPLGCLREESGHQGREEGSEGTRKSLKAIALSVWVLQWMVKYHSGLQEAPARNKSLSKLNHEIEAEREPNKADFSPVTSNPGPMKVSWISVSKNRAMMETGWTWSRAQDCPHKWGGGVLPGTSLTT